MTRTTPGRHRVRRSVRALAAGLALAVLAGGLAGCADPPDEVTVLGPWLGDEADRFTEVLDGAGVRYRYQGTRTPAEALRSARQTGEGADIVVFPDSGELATFVKAGEVLDLRDLLGGERDNYDPFWLASPRSPAPSIHSIPVKVNLKSLVWRDTERTPAEPTWSEALAGRWCMGMGNPPNSGWPGTDWIEDILLHQPKGWIAYAAWAAGELPWTAPELREAWLTWGDVVRRTPGGGVSALLTQYGDAGRGLSSTDPADTSAAAPEPCTYDHQPSFILGSYRAYQPDLDRFDFSRYAPAGTSQNWSVVSPDVAALFRDTAPARAMMRHLASERGQSVWPAADGAFSAHTKVRVPDPDSVAGRIGDIVAGRTDTKFCLDASDLMPTEMREAFYAGVRDYLSRLDDPAALPAVLARLEEVRTRSRAQWDVTRPACSPDD